MSTFIPSAKSIERRWHVIDAAGQSLGRVASLAAKVLQGKHKPIYTPYIDCGDHVVVVNAGQAVLTGHKEEQKLYRYHSGYEGGLREERAKAQAQAEQAAMMNQTADTANKLGGVQTQGGMSNAANDIMNLFSGYNSPSAETY
jgi:large subunit ribosomal protein L13